jgi:hypothetical protein
MNVRGWLLVCALASAMVSDPAHAWGDEGHEIIALVAGHYLKPTVRAKVAALLAADTSGLTPTDLAAEATWADKFRDSDRNTTKVRYSQTREWHFVDIELADADVAAACSGHPALPPGTDASAGPARNCLIDKIDQFIAELRGPATSAAERLLALQFLLHFVGDVHQPLHASDDHDRGGNDKIVMAAGFADGNLHHFWDTEFVRRLGARPAWVATALVRRIGTAQRRQWAAGTPTDWALDTFAVSKAHTYGKLPPAGPDGSHLLTPAYVADATRTVSLQLRKAGVRLASVLNAALQ